MERQNKQKTVAYIYYILSTALAICFYLLGKSNYFHKNPIETGTLEEIKSFIVKINDQLDNVTIKLNNMENDEKIEYNSRNDNVDTNTSTNYNISSYLTNKTVAVPFAATSLLLIFLFVINNKIF